MLKALITLLLISLLTIGCNSSAVKDAIDIISDPPRKTIDTSRMGVNAFVNDTRFGSISSQFREVRDTLRLGYVRVLFDWNEGIQSSPNASPNFSFYDNIVDRLPSGIEALVVVTGVPNWMNDSANWIAGNPRTTFVQLWVKKVAERYAGNPRIVGYEVWNEPNMTANPENILLNVDTSPENYVELLAAAHGVIKAASPGKLVLNGATTAINQNFPDSVDYNRGMRDAGATSFVDVWAVHYYGKQFENVVRGSGVEDFLEGIGKSVWVTESGAQGVNNQLAYCEQVWPFLREKIPNIERFYYYQLAEDTPAETSYGLRTLSSAFPVSDLYVYLRDR